MRAALIPLMEIDGCMYNKNRNFLTQTCKRLIIISNTAEAINSFINFDFHSDPITLRKLKQGDRFLACRTLKKSTHTYDYQDG